MTPEQTAALDAAIPSAERERVVTLMGKGYKNLTREEKLEIHAIAVKAAAIIPPPPRVAAAIARVAATRR
jgi:hypothetical protein